MPRFLELERRERSIILGLWRAIAGAPQTGTSGARWSLFVTLRGRHGGDGHLDRVAPAAGRGAAQAARGRHRAQRRGWQRGRRPWARARGRPRHRARPSRTPRAVCCAYVDPALAHLARRDPVRVVGDGDASAIGAADVPHPLDGFGFVVPHTERRLRVRVHVLEREVSGPRARRATLLLRCFVGGALNEGILESDDSALIAGARNELRELLGITGEPVLVAGGSLDEGDAAVPRRPRGPRRDDRAMRRGDPGLHLAGGAYRGVGIADCVRSGEAAAEQVFGASKRPRAGGPSRPPISTRQSCPA